MDTQRLGHSRLAGWALAGLLLGGAALWAGCKSDNGGGTVVTPDVTINIVSGAFNKGMMAFSPASATAHVGDLVRMHNGDSITHNIQTVTTGGPSWGVISGGGNSDVTVTATGVYNYKCVIASHSMTGSIDVQP